MRWLYLLTLLPTLADWMEVGHLPRTVREWSVELTLTPIIAYVVHLANREHREVAAAALTDALTGLPNRRAFRARGPGLLARSRERGEAFSLAVLDLDGFKQLNDLAGHDAGDDLLAQLSRVLSDGAARHGLSCYRMGGDEFLILAPGLPEADLRIAVVAMQAACSERIDSFRSGQTAMSVGVVDVGPDVDLESAQREADRLMYGVKPRRSR